MVHDPDTLVADCSVRRQVLTRPEATISLEDRSQYELPVRDAGARTPTPPSDVDLDDETVPVPAPFGPWSTDCSCSVDLAVVKGSQNSRRASRHLYSAWL